MTIKTGMKFKAFGRYWKVVNWDDTDHLWICQDIREGDIRYFSKQRIYFFMNRGG